MTRASPTWLVTTTTRQLRAAARAAKVPRWLQGPLLGFLESLIVQAESAITAARARCTHPSPVVQIAPATGPIVAVAVCPDCARVLVRKRV